jgi:hypothetical protein
MTGDPGSGSKENRDDSPTFPALLREIELAINDLKWVEARLGTAAELAGDMDRARELAHRINNLLTSYRLKSDLRDIGPEI